MRKKIFSVVLAVAMVASLTACGKSSSDSSSSTTNTSITADQYAGTITTNAEKYKKYVTMPTYTGVEVTVDRSSLEVSEDDINSYITNVLSGYATTESQTEGTTASGDTVTMDYSGLLDGVAFSGGTATDVSYTIGSGNFIDDLDKGLVGLTVGQQYDIPCTFPADYSSSDLAGKAVTFVVTVSAIQKSISPDLTDEWVASNNTALGTEATTVDGFKTYVKDYLTSSNESTFQSSKFDSIWTILKDKITVTGYPQDEVDTLTATLKSNVQAEFNQYGSYYGITDFSSYLNSVYGFSTEDDFNSYAVEYSQEYLMQKMAITIIASEQNITVTADDINAMGADLASYYGYDSFQEILDSYGNEMNSEVGYECLYQKVQTFLNDSAVEV